MIHKSIKLFKVLTNPKNLLKGVESVNKYGLKYTLKKISSLNFQGVVTHSREWVDIRKQDKVFILTTKHCYFIAALIKFNLRKIGLNAEIVFKMPQNGFGDGVHFVICPQMFASLPKVYIAFQLEQSSNSRWFTTEYIDALKNAYAVLDYSLDNIDYLQQQKLSYKQTYFMPLSYHSELACLTENGEMLGHEEYDVLFYGDVKNARRKEYLDELSKRFKVKIIKNVFLDELYQEIKKAKVIVNIHYYDDALLETTRLYECLSLNKLIVSEKSKDYQLYDDINQTVDFVNIGDIQEMCDRIEFWLSDDSSRKSKINTNAELLKNANNMFEYYFMRFMLSNDWIDFDTFYGVASHNISFQGNFICLSLPETSNRIKSFQTQNHYGIEIFPGLRHDTSWLGCGMSFKFLIKKAKDMGLDTITICEDDVEFYPNFLEEYTSTKTFLSQRCDWDIFAGLIADVDNEMKIKGHTDYKGRRYIAVDRMTSMVLNIYSARCYEQILSWNEQDRNAESNTIDRYLEKNTDYTAITTIPYLVGHRESVDSTLWGISNNVYTEMIKNSEKKLLKKVNEFKSELN